MCNDRSIWTIDCRKFDDPCSDLSLRKHIGRNPRILKSIMRSKNYCELHSRSLTKCLDSFRATIVIVPLRKLSCGRTRWLATVDVNSPFPCCNCLNLFSGNICVRESWSAANSQRTSVKRMQETRVCGKLGTIRQRFARWRR